MNRSIFLRSGELPVAQLPVEVAHRFQRARQWFYTFCATTKRLNKPRTWSNELQRNSDAYSTAKRLMINEWSDDLAGGFESWPNSWRGGELSLPDRWMTSLIHFTASFPDRHIIPCRSTAAISVRSLLLPDWTLLTCPLPVLLATTNTFQI